MIKPRNGKKTPFMVIYHGTVQREDRVETAKDIHRQDGITADDARKEV
jgi:hypothetical protein